MCIYCNTNNYRKIYENHYGPIPKDSNGRSYDIHHIDSNRKNNNPSNLKSVSIQEHYDIHYAQEEWTACILIALRLDLTPKEISDLAREFNHRRVKNGTHPFVGGEIQRRTHREKLLDGTHHMLQENNQSRQRVNNNTHNLLKRPDGTSTTSDRVIAGTHNWLGPENNLKNIKNGTHPFVKRFDGTSLSSDRVKNGTHHWLGGDAVQKQIEKGTHPSFKQISCIFCKKTSAVGMFTRWHGNKCRYKTSDHEPPA